MNSTRPVHGILEKPVTDCCDDYNSGMRGNNLFIVIPVFNGWQQTRTCLTRLQQSTCTDFRVIVVDHGSSDETQTGLADEFPDVVRVAGSPDMWWTAATNLGIRSARDQGAQFIMLLNNDCYVEKDTLATLLSHAEGTHDAVIAPLQRSLQGGDILSHRLTSCLLLGLPTLRLPGRADFTPGQPRLVSTRMIIGGRGVLIPAALFDRVGLFNERELPHYGADHDFYLRCRKAGVRLHMATDTVVDIDQARSTRAADPGSLSWHEFLATLRERRSHRNLAALTALFRLHYPVPLLYPLGVALNLLRYTLVYLVARAARLAGLGKAAHDERP